MQPIINAYSKFRIIKTNSDY